MTSKPNLFFRQDTLFGACQGLADDLGINALWLRVPLASIILYGPEIALGIYAVLCVAVFTTRKIWPAKPAAVEAEQLGSEPAPVEVSATDEQRELALAA